jgi:thiol:disulfide interchange protein DsbD
MFAMLRRASLLLLLPLFLCPVSAAQAARVSADVSAAVNVSALKPGEPAMLAVVVSVHAGLHAQSHQPLDPNLIAFELTADDNPLLQFSPPIFPPGDIENYPALGRLSVYTGRIIIYLPVTARPGTAAGPITVSGELTLQACNESSCFPPEHPKFSVTTNVAAAGDVITPINSELFASIPKPSAPPPPVPPPSTVSSQTTISLFGRSVDLSQHGVPLAMLIAFLAGIVFNVVPCVLPVLPVKAVGFYEASQHSRARSLLLGLVFSIGLVAVFALLGMVVLLSGSIFHEQITWGQQFSNPWFAWGLAVVLAGLALAMMGAFSLRLPTSVYGLDFRHDTLGGNFLWGGLTAILSTPCTAPLFPPVLIFAATLPRIEGFLLVTTVGCGMAWPYFVLSAFPGVARRFPRTGALAELVKQMMGFLLLGTAAFFVGQQLIGEPNQWWLVFAVAVWACVYLAVRTAQIAKSAGALYLATALAVAIAGGSLMLTLRLTAPDQVQWQPYSPQALAEARQAGKIVLIDFTANWCLNCKYVDLTVFHDPRTLEAIKQLDVVTMKADLSDDHAIGWQLRNSLGSDGIPYTAIYLPNADQPIGLASIYTTDTLLTVLNGGPPRAAAGK